MSVIIRGHRVQTSSAHHNAGVFIGQNIQDGWDSIVSEKGSAAYSMGDFTSLPTGVAAYFGWSWLGQPVFDNDVEGNLGKSYVR